MTLPSVFAACEPRPDVLTGALTEADFAADLAEVDPFPEDCLVMIARPAAS